MVTSRFEENTLRDWQKYLADTKEPPAREQLNKFIDRQIICLEALESSSKPWPPQSHSTPKKRATSNTHQTQPQASDSNSSAKPSAKAKNNKICSFCK